MQQTMEVCKLLWHSLHGIHIRRVPSISVAFRSIIPTIPSELGGWPGSLWGTREGAPLAVGPPFGPHLDETSEAELFVLGPFSSSLLILSSMFVGGRQFLLRYLFLPNLVINLVLQIDVLDTLFCILPAQNWGSTSSSLRSVK